MKRFMEFIGNYREEDPLTHQGISPLKRLFVEWAAYERLESG